MSRMQDVIVLVLAVVAAVVCMKLASDSGAPVALAALSSSRSWYWSFTCARQTSWSDKKISSALG